MARKKVDLDLSAFLVKREEDGLWFYKEGWNDARVAYNLGLSKNTVADTRKRKYGFLRTIGVRGYKEPETGMSVMRRRFDELEAKLDRILAAVELQLKSDGT
jgi:hypothetical protein